MAKEIEKRVRPFNFLTMCVMLSKTGNSINLSSQGLCILDS